MTDLTSAAFRSLYKASHKRLREDFAAQSADTINREMNRVLDIEAAKLVAQCSAIINGSATSTDKIGELCSLLLSCEDEYEDDEDEDTTGVDTYPHTK